MAHTVDYYFAPISPWAYLGHARFARMAQDSGATVRVLPVDLGQVFPVSGGLPLAKRAPQRQAYRLVELARFGQHLGVPIIVQPKFFPAPGDDAARLIVAVDQADGSAAAMRIAGAVMSAVWAQDRNIASADTLAQLLAENNLPAERLQAAQTEAVRTAYEGYTRQAVEQQVFGSPSYVVDGELFWGQDRLDFVERRLQQA